MMRPWPRSRIPSSTARVQRTVPRRLICTSRCQVSSVESTKGWITSTPALLTRTWMGPSSRSIRPDGLPHAGRCHATSSDDAERCGDAGGPRPCARGDRLGARLVDDPPIGNGVAIGGQRRS